MYHHINQRSKKSRNGWKWVKTVCKKVEMGEIGRTSKNAISPMHQNLVANNNDAQSTTKYGFLLQPDSQIVALCAHSPRTALKAPPLACSGSGSLDVGTGQKAVGPGSRSRMAYGIGGSSAPWLGMVYPSPISTSHGWITHIARSMAGRGHIAFPLRTICPQLQYPVGH